MLPVERSKVQQEESIGLLKAYAFIQSRTDSQHQGDRSQRPAKAFDVHPLVHLAMRSWMKANHLWKDWGDKVSTRLIEIVPDGAYLDSISAACSSYYRVVWIVRNGEHDVIIV